MAAQLDFEDIQHFLLTRTPALAARYEFLSFASAAAGRAWLAGLVDKVGTGRSVGTASPDHCGYRDRLPQPVIAGTDEQPTPGSGPPVKAGEFFLGYDDESGAPPPLPQPELLSRNGSYLAYLRMEEHVGAFREFLRLQ